MTRKKADQPGPKPIKMVRNTSSSGKKRGYFPDTWPGGFEAFDNGDYFTAEHLPKDGSCSGTTIIRRYKVNTEQLLQTEGYGLRPKPDELHKFLSKYPSRKKDLQYLISSGDVGALTSNAIDYNKLSIQELYERINALDEEKDPAEFMFLDNLIRERSKSRGNKNE